LVIAGNVSLKEIKEVEKLIVAILKILVLVSKKAASKISTVEM
jgi:hypothetical protein